MGARVDGLSRTDSSSSQASSSSSDGEDASFSVHKLGYRSTRVKPVGSALLGHKKDVTLVFDKVDGLVDKAQSLCEKAAHQILRDGDCKQELETAMKSFDEAKTQAESEIPALRQRVEKAAERERRSDERRRTQEEAEERKRESGRELSNTEKQLTSFPPSDGKLEVDLEADDSDGDEGDFNAGFDLGHFQMRTLERFEYSNWTSLVSQAIRSVRTQPSPSFAAESSQRDVKAAVVVRRGPLRGLDPNNVLPTPATQPSREVPHSDDELAIMDEEDASCELPRSTRAARSGRKQVNYDMKYHPMDEVTRPKRAAKRAPASCSPKTNIKIDLESSDGSSDIDLDLLSGEDESELESDNKENEMVRKPDPRATRHSARSEAQKAVNYSRKHHPQDHGLPGFQRRAKRIKLEHSDILRKKLRPRVGTDDEHIGSLQQGNNGPNEGDSGVQEDDDQQMGTIVDLTIHSQNRSSERDEGGRPHLKPFASFKDDNGSASTEDAGVANSTDNESAHDDHVAETGFNQSEDIDFLGFFPIETYDKPEPQTSSLGAGMEEELVNVEEQTQLQRDDASLTIVKPYFSGYQGYVLNPIAVPFEFPKATMVDHDLSQPQDFDQPATGSLFSEADATGVTGMPKYSQLALDRNQETGPQASQASKSFVCLEESSMNQSNASPSSSSNTLSAFDKSSPGAVTPSLNLNDAEEEHDSTHSFVPVSAQLQPPPARNADAHNSPPSAYLPVIHVQHEFRDDLVSSLLSSLGQNESAAVKPTIEDSDLPSTCAQSFASAEETNEAPPSGQGDH
ncbi:hypothetical protein KC319_g10516 [Hortaea werneckii]|nr:hypothetical protein KC317_g8169 [Hortaea werneckii]KAI7613388.1 hypothetical protein KC346_g7357 [Hortaea werneckii]KAI7653356.1 hypothetical protein KC319_g10516 [Hortaea werneckii]KAI7702098.1 hypothetical protein KC322_g7573 [Hortaea werneckii]